MRLRNDAVWNTSLVTVIILCALPVFCEQDFSSSSKGSSHVVQCDKLRMGQYICNKTGTIDPATQQPRDCTPKNIAKIPCKAVEGLICKESGNRTFTKTVPCKWTNGYHLSTSLLLSVFFGTLGIDRIYLGHIGMGVLKMSTLGFLFVGQLVDIILIATENLTPRDGSHFVTGFYGPAVQSLRANNLTYVVHRADWFT